MFSILWEYQVKPEKRAEFVEAYASNGRWAELFRKSPSYLETKLLQDENHPGRYLTIDRWKSKAAYETFQSEWAKEYQALDLECEGLTVQEALLGRYTESGQSY